MYNMKRKIYYFLGLAFSLLFAACSDDNNNDGSNISPVSNVEVTAGYGQLMLSWVNPPEEDFYYVDITYTDANGNHISNKVSKFSVDTLLNVSVDTLRGFTDTNKYDLSLTAYTLSGKHSAPIIVSAAPLEPAFNIALNSVEMNSDFGGAIIRWENNTGQKLTLQVRYKNDENEKTTAIFDASKSGSGSISGLAPVQKVFEAFFTDALGNNSAVKTFTIVPMAEVKIDKSKWTVLAYSSQEPAEGGNPNGLVIAAFDDNLSTYWHTQWNGASPGYPHFFAVDMHQEVSISRVVCDRRKGDSRGQTQFQILTSLDGVNWEDQGTFDFNSSSDADQSYRLVNNPRARYFKYVALKGPNFFAFLGEITIYGSLE
jgi:hypothetical protein